MSIQSGRVYGKVALISGGASGMGAAIATRFVREGASVIIADMDAGRGRALEERLGQSGALHAAGRTVRGGLDQRRQ